MPPGGLLGPSDSKKSTVGTSAYLNVKLIALGSTGSQAEAEFNKRTPAKQVVSSFPLNDCLLTNLPP
jgi:hypothetical protein